MRTVRIAACIAAVLFFNFGNPISFLGVSALTYNDIVLGQIGGRVLGSATPAFVQAAAGAQCNYAATCTTGALTTTSGDLLVLSVTISSSVDSVTDSRNNTWNLIGSSKSSADTVYLYYAKNIAGGSGHTVTVHAPDDAHQAISVAEYSGLDTTAPLDTFATKTGTGLTQSTASIAASQGNELIVAVFNQTAGINAAWSAGANYTMRASVGGADVGSVNMLEDRIADSAGSYTATATFGSQTGSWSNVIAAFKSGSPPPPSPPLISSFSASPSSIIQGNSATLSWNVSGNPAPTLSINNGVGTVTGSSVTVTPATTTAYTITATNSEGWTTAQTTITVGAPPPPDAQAPSTPQSLSATAVSSSQINLSWSASTDNVGVTGYKVFRNGSQVGTSGINSYSDTGLSASTTYAYTVSAYDAAGNNSAQSSSASATTQTAVPSTNLILEDFTTRRQSWANDGTQLENVYFGEDGNQIDNGFSNGQWSITGATGTSNCYVGCGIYWQFSTAPYSWNAGSTPNGFMQSYVKSGTFTTDINRLQFKLMCDKTIPSNAPAGTFDIGTYVKPHSDNDQRNQGQHYYHTLSPNIYASRWVLVEINEQPQHQVGVTSHTPSLDPEFSSPSEGAPVHYMDGLTRWYFDSSAAGSNGQAWARTTCYFKDIQLRAVSGEPDHEVSSVTGTYNGSAFEVSFAAPAPTSQVYNIRYSRTSLKTAGFASGTDGGTRQATGDDYPSIIWTSPAMAESSGLYVAIQPQGQSAFTEVYIPNLSGSGSSDTAAPSTPQSLSATAVSSSQINLSWSASTDNVGVSGYKVYRNGTQIATTASTSYNNTGLSAGTSYSYTVSAYDAAGNNSSQSSSASAATASNPDTTAPTASLTSPSSGTYSGSITLSATASDPAVSGQTTSGLFSLSLLVDGTVFATSSAGSLSRTLDTTTLSNASHTLTAKAQDNAGNTFTTPGVSITVNNAQAAKYPRKITLSGLEGLSALNSYPSLTITILSPGSGSTLETQSLSPDASHNYTVTFLSSDPQLVNIRVKAQGYLSQVLSSIDTTQNTSQALTVPSLYAGDFNNDNTVNSLDYSVLNTHYNQNYPQADINQDSIVNSFDYAILKNNWNRGGG